MWIRFKFRSSVSFDVVDIGDKAVISVGELKAKIIAYKKLKLGQGFDLVFSDYLTGLEYNDENYQIPSNSDVIIKRVPAGSVPPALPCDSFKNLLIKKSDVLEEKGRKMENLNDFGIDLCLIPDKIFPYSDLESERKNIRDIEKANIVGSRLGGQKLQTNDLVEVIPKGLDHNGTKGKLPPEKLEPQVQKHVKLEPGVQENVKLGKRAIDPYDLAEKNAYLSSAFRCPICTKFLKEAVMTRCCLLSFCERCIRRVLSEKSKCPKCSSDKYKAENLMPNVSLRLAIKSFLKSQIQCSIPETVLRRYVPDAESVIQANDLPNALTMYQKRQMNLLYPSAAEKRSNCILGESFHGESKTGYHPGFAESQGENYPLNLLQNHEQEKGENRKVLATAKYKKADHTCYLSDAPDHFIKDCPFANGPHPLLQTGNFMYAVGARPTFVAPYWNNTAYGPMRPFTSIYPNHGMMPYSASMFPVSPIGVSPYMASMTAYSGFPRMAGMAPLAGNRTENHFRHEDFLETRTLKIRGNHSKEYMRIQPSDDDGADIQTDRHNLPKSSKKYLFHPKRINSGSYSGEKHTQRSRGNDLRTEHLEHNKHSRHDRYGKNSRSLIGTRDRKAYNGERSNSGGEDMSNSSERHKHRHHKITRNHYERKGHFGSGSNWNEHQGQKDKRVFSDEKEFSNKHDGQFGSGVESSFSGDWKKQQKEGGCRRSSKHTRDGTKYTGNELFCRSKMVGRDEDLGEDDFQLKRKRVY